MLVEEDVPDEVGMVRAARPSDLVEQAGHTFEQAVGGLRRPAAAIIAQLRELDDPPEQVTVEFGLKLSAKAGAIIASADAEGNFKVTLSWKRAAPPTG